MADTIIRANARYTARELVEAAGLDPDVFGEMRVVIGGVRGIVRPDHEIRIAAGTESVDVRVGVDVATVKVEQAE